MFDLKIPCTNCPFRRGITYNLSPGRVFEIVEAPAFQCHKTVDYSEDEPAPGDRPQQCAGLMAVLHRESRPNLIMQVAQQFGELNPDTLDPRNEAYGSVAEMFAAQRNDEMDDLVAENGW